MYLATPGLPDPVAHAPRVSYFTQLLQRLVDWVRDNDIDVKRVGIVLSSEAEFFQHIVDQVVDPVAGACGSVPQAGSRAGRVSRGR